MILPRRLALLAIQNHWDKIIRTELVQEHFHQPVSQMAHACELAFAMILSS